MTTAEETREPQTEPGRGSLARAETRRFVHRRLIRILALLVVAGSMVAAITMSFQFSRPTPQLLAEGQQQLDAAVAAANLSRDECLAQVPAGESAEMMCGPVATADDFGGMEQFLPRPAFLAAEQLPGVATAVGVALGVVAFLVGATWIGAEWSSRALVSLLFWEPRRLRVLSVKAGVLAATVAGFAALVAAAWTGFGLLLGATKGSAELPADFWSGFLAMQGRIVLAVALSSLAGFALAHLVRNTGAALGIAFVLLAVVEPAVGAFWPAWQQWRVTDNALALVLADGWTIRYWEDTSYLGEPTEIVLNNWHGGLVLGGLVAATLAVGAILFQRRDLT